MPQSTGRAVKKNEYTQAISSKLEIFTLGNFRVLAGAKDLTEKSRRSARVWEIFKFLLTFRDRKTSFESITDTLWPDHDYNDPEATMHTLIHRVRKIFYEEFPPDEPPFTIDVVQRTCCMKLNSNCWLDVDQFKFYAKQAKEAANKGPDEAIRLYREALSYYKGDYLKEYSSKSWVQSITRQYRQQYLQCLLSKIKLQLDQGNHAAVLNACENAFRLDYYMEVEALHLYYMEALYRSGDLTGALCHYDFITSNLYNEFGAKPSVEMRNLYRKIKPDLDSPGLNLPSICDKLEEREGSKGAFVCDLDFFRFLYQLEKRRCDRGSNNLAMGLFTVYYDHHLNLSVEAVNHAVNRLEEVLVGCLRKGDVITRWGDNQYLAFLVNTSYENANGVFRRITECFNSALGDKGFSLEISRRRTFPEN